MAFDYVAAAAIWVGFAACVRILAIDRRPGLQVLATIGAFLGLIHGYFLIGGAIGN